MRNIVNYILLSMFSWMWITDPFISVQMCAEFDFPTITDLKVTRKENSLTNMTFALRNMNCSTFNDIHIRVYKNTSPYCELWMENGSCSSGNSRRCSCITRFGPFLFTKALDRTDSLVWIWYAYENLLRIAVERITFNITYFAQVTNLTLNGQEESLHIARNQNVRISCSWENGNPPTSMKLFGGNGNLLLSNTSSGVFTHILPDVQCQDSGVVLCMADGARRNRSATLHVKCPEQDDNYTVQNSVHTSHSAGENLIIIGTALITLAVIIIFTASVTFWHRRRSDSNTSSFTSEAGMIVNDVYESYRL